MVQLFPVSSLLNRVARTQTLDNQSYQHHYDQNPSQGQLILVKILAHVIYLVNFQLGYSRDLNLLYFPFISTNNKQFTLVKIQVSWPISLEVVLHHTFHQSTDTFYQSTDTFYQSIGFRMESKFRKSTM